MFSVSNENVSAVVRLEIDQDYGKTEPAPTNNQLDGADKGTDNKVAEVKWAYVQVKDVLIPNLTLTTGLKDYYYPLIVDNDFALTSASYDFGMGSVTLGYIKVDEYSVDEQDAAGNDVNTDVQSYVADVTVKAGNITARPAYFYTKDESSAYRVSNYALNVAGDFGMVNVEATGAYLTLATEADDFTAYAYDLGVNVKPVEGLTIGLFTSYNSGTTATDMDTVGFNATMDGLLGAPDGRLFLLEANSVDGNGGHQDYYDETQSEYGYAVYGINAEYVIGKVALFAQYGYMVSAEDNTAGDSAIGSEIDGKISLEVAPATSLFVEIGYLMAGDDTFYADNATQYAWGLTTKI